MKLLAFAAIVAFCGAEKLDRTYLPPPGAKLSGGSPGAINTPHGSTGSEPDYQKFLTPPVESDSSVPFSREPSQSSQESSGVQRPGVSFEQGTQQSSIGSRPLSKDAPSMSISQGGNQRIQGLQDTTRPGGAISHESRPGLDSSSAMPGSNERFPNSNTDSRYPGSRPSFRDSVPSIPTYQGSGQHIQSSPGRPFSQGSRPSISDSLSTVPISEGTIQRFPEENLPTRSETSFTQGSRPSLSDFTPAAPINQNADQPISNYNGQSSLGPSRSPSVFSGSTSQVPNQRIPVTEYGFNDSARPEIAIMEGSRPSLTDSKLIDSQPSYGQDSSRRPLGNRYDYPLETVTTPSKINNQESSQHRARPNSNYETKPISKPDQAYDTPKNSLPNQYIPSSEHNQQTYDSPVSQQTTNYQNDNRRGPDSDSNRLPYQDNRASAAFPNGAGSQSPISDTRYQKPSSGKVLPQGNGPVRGSSIGLPTSQDSGSKLPSKGGDAMFESEATSSPIETDVDYDDDIAISGIDSNGNPEIPSTNAEGDQSPLIKSGLRNQNNRYVQYVDRPQAALERTAGIIRYKNVINPDGTFAYDFETENGIKAQEHGTSANGVQAEGDFSYVGDDGQVYSITYTADERGYQPQGDHLPTSPPIPDAILRSLEIIAQQEAAGELDDGSYDEHKYGPAQFGVGNENEESNRLIQESRGNDDFEPRTKTENENDDDLDSIEIKAAEPGSNDYDYNSADNEQHLNQAQRPNYGSRPESSSSINGEGNKYFRAGNTPKTNIGRHGVTSEPRRFETTTSSISRRPSFNGLSESATRNTESPSSLKYTTSDSQTLSPGNRNYQTNPSTPGFEYTTILPDFSVPAVRGSQSIYPKTSQDYTPVKPGNGVPVSQGNRPNVNKRPQVAYSPTVVDSKNEDKVYSREMLPKSSTQYLPAKQGSLSPNNRYQDQDTQPKITSEYTSFVPGKFGSDISQKQQPHYSVEYKSPQVYPSLSSNEDYQTNSPTTSLQYTTHVPIMGERKYQKTLPKSSLMYIPSAPGSLPTENQDYDESLPKQSSEDRPPARGSSPLDVTRYQTSTKSPISEVRNYQNGFPKAALQNTASPEGTRNNVGNIHPGNEYEGDINKSMVNTIIPGADRNKPERIQESIYSNNRGPNKFNRPEYGSTTTQRQPFLDETKDQVGVRYSQELNGQPISQFNTQSPNTQAIRLTTIRPSQYQTGDVTLENFNGATKSPYVPNHYENIKVTKGPFRAVTTIMPEINQEYEAEDNYNIQPSRDIEGDFGRRTESRPQYNISSKHIMQTSNPDIDNEDGYNYQVPKTHFNHHQYSSSPQHFNQPDRGQGQTDKPTGEDYGTTVGNRNIYTTTISPGSTQRNKYPSVTTIRPQSSTTFRNDVNRYNEAPNSEELNNSGIDGNDNSRPNYVRNNQPNQPFSQQTLSQYNPSDRNLNGRPQNRPTSQQYNRFSPQSELQAQGPQDDRGNPELHGESILEGQLDGTSQRPFGRPQSNTSKAYPQSGGNGRPRPTPFVKEFPASNTFIGAGEKFPESRRPPSYSPEAGYKY